jgi:hypothetical protein
MSPKLLQEITDRLTRIENEVREIKTKLNKKEEKTGWQAIVGSHANSEVFDEIIKEVEKNRREDYEAAAAAIDRQQRRAKSAKRRARG